VVRSPKSGVNFFSLGDFEEQLELACVRAQPAINQVMRPHLSALLCLLSQPAQFVSLDNLEQICISTPCIKGQLFLAISQHPAMQGIAYSTLPYRCGKLCQGCSTQHQISGNKVLLYALLALVVRGLM